MKATGFLVMGLAFAATACSRTSSEERVRAITGGDPTRGKQTITEHGCGACHTIPGVVGAHGEVGPPLAKFGKRSYIAGLAPNTPDNLARFVENPRAVHPETAMPNLGLSHDEARDVAAYLTSLD